METRKSSERIALFIDLENFVGCCSSLGLPIDLSFEINRLTETGKVTIRRSYGDIQKLPVPNHQKQEIRKMLQNNLIQHEDIPYQTEFKNSSDIRLVIDVISTVYSNEDINYVAVVAADRDYIPLFVKLREIGKETIGIGGSRDNTPDLIIKSCDRFFYHEELSGRSSIPPVQQTSEQLLIELAANNTQTEPVTNNSDQEAFKLLVEALKALETMGHSVVSPGNAISMIRRMKSDFDYHYYGYKTFNQLCLQAEAMGLINTEKHGATYNIHLPEFIEINNEPSNTEQPLENTGENDCEQFKAWFERKTKIVLPSRDQRESIYAQLLIFMQDFKDEEGIKLSALSSVVSERIKTLNCTQQICYKLLFNLYRANCFHCSLGGDIQNPIICELIDIKVTSKSLDDKFIKNVLRLYRRECQIEIIPKTWSEVFFENMEESQRIEDILRSL
jgi:uncharacterized LabA/DUF88 family protein